MKSTLSLLVVSIFLALLLTGCSKKSSSNTNANSNNSNTTVTTTIENENIEQTDETAEDSTLSPKTDRTKSVNKTTSDDKSSTANAPKNKPTPEKEPPTKSAEKTIRKQGDRVLRDTGGVIKEGERKIRGILGGKP